MSQIPAMLRRAGEQIMHELEVAASMVESMEGTIEEQATTIKLLNAKLREANGHAK